MRKPRVISAFAGTVILTLSGWLVSRAQDSQLPSHPECSFFGANRDAFVKTALKPGESSNQSSALTAVTEQVTEALGYVPGGSRTRSFDLSHRPASIDSYLYADMQGAGITPA